MTPGARLAAVVELLEAVAAARPPIEPIVERFVRARRYMGAKDRRAVAERLYAVIRAERRLDWWLARAGCLEPTPRRRLIAHLLLADGLAPADLALLFSGNGHAASPLDAAENSLAAALVGQPLDHPQIPAAVAGEVPDWLAPALTAAFGDRAAAELAALNAAAPLDLRVNTLKATREAAQEALAGEGVAGTPTPMSPIGLRVEGRAALPATRAFRDGLIEVQDEGSQLVALIAAAKPGMTVIDFCAGAGGKTLALAAAMGRGGAVDGTLWALDVEARFLDRLADRARRAGAGRIRTHTLVGEDDAAWLAGHAEGADLVLVDAPCSGSGTWRRHPAAKRWLTPERLAELMASQGQALAAAAGLVRPGGRLVYATCSVLPAENDDRVAAFLAARPDFALLPAADAWAAAGLAGPCPSAGPHLRLTPAATGTDGFFAAVMGRAA